MAIADHEFGTELTKLQDDYTRNGIRIVIDIADDNTANDYGYLEVERMDIY